MNAPINRALHLFQISRYADAELELRRALAEHPHDPQAHALLGLCLARQEKLPEAQAEVEQAILLAPDWDYAHFCRATVLQDRRRYDDALASIREALRLDPASPRNYARLAAILYSQGKWQESLDAALDGLQYDAEHVDCTSYRTAALTKLGRQQEAIATVDESLARDPDDSYAHANKAWALLHEGKPRPAIEHFQEALRLDPTNEYARHGMVEALKARNPIYRVVLGYFLWMARLDGKARWAVILGAYFGSQLLAALSRSMPALTPWILPIQIAYLLFVLLTWFAMPLFNLLLRLNRFGRHALSQDQRRASNWFGLCVAIAIGCVIATIVTDNWTYALAAIVTMGTALPIVTIFQCEPGWPRQATTLLSVAMALIGALGTYGIVQEYPWGPTLMNLFLQGFIFNPLIVGALQPAVVRR